MKTDESVSMGLVEALSTVEDVLRKLPSPPSLEALSGAVGSIHWVLGSYGHIRVELLAHLVSMPGLGMVPLTVHSSHLAAPSEEEESYFSDQQGTSWHRHEQRTLTGRLATCRQPLSLHMMDSIAAGALLWCGEVPPAPLAWRRLAQQVVGPALRRAAREDTSCRYGRTERYTPLWRCPAVLSLLQGLQQRVVRGKLGPASPGWPNIGGVLRGILESPDPEQAARSIGMDGLTPVNLGFEGLDTSKLLYYEPQANPGHIAVFHALRLAAWVGGGALGSELVVQGWKYADEVEALLRSPLSAAITLSHSPAPGAPGAPGCVAAGDVTPRAALLPPITFQAKSTFNDGSVKFTPLTPDQLGEANPRLQWYHTLLRHFLLPCHAKQGLPSPAGGLEVLIHQPGWSWAEALGLRAGEEEGADAPSLLSLSSWVDPEWGGLRLAPCRLLDTPREHKATRDDEDRATVRLPWTFVPDGQRLGALLCTLASVSGPAAAAGCVLRAVAEMGEVVKPTQVMGRLQTAMHSREDGLTYDDMLSGSLTALATSLECLEASRPGALAAGLTSLGGSGTFSASQYGVIGLAMQVCLVAYRIGTPEAAPLPQWPPAHQVPIPEAGTVPLGEGDTPLPRVTQYLDRQKAGEAGRGAVVVCSASSGKGNLPPSSFFSEAAGMDYDAKRLRTAHSYALQGWQRGLGVALGAAVPEPLVQPHMRDADISGSNRALALMSFVVDAHLIPLAYTLVQTLHGKGCVPIPTVLRRDLGQGQGLQVVGDTGGSPWYQHLTWVARRGVLLHRRRVRGGASEPVVPAGTVAPAADGTPASRKGKRQRE